MVAGCLTARSVCRALGARYVIAVNLNFDILGRGSVISAPELMFSEADEQLQTAAETERQGKKGVRALLQRQILGKGDGAPGISTVMVDALNIVQDRIARSRLAGDPPDAMISPRLQDIGLFDFHRAEAAIERGRLAVERQLDDIVRELEICDPKRAPNQMERARAQTGALVSTVQPVAK